ncbi:MAG: GDSL-type esterase/lipase family protein [Chitinophagales bacterium]
MQENHLKYSVLGTAMLLAVLLALYVIPEFDLGEFHFKRINLLADVMKSDNSNLAKMDSSQMVKPVFADTCKTGVTCVEDYSKDTSGLKNFLAALDSVKNRPVRIAWFADSYVEGDIMLDPLRDTLQAIYGGSGVGFVPITSEVAGFRQTVIHTFDNITTYSVVGDKSPQHSMGPAGFTYVPQPGNRVHYSAIKRARLNSFPVAQLYYGNTEGAKLLLNEATTVDLAAASAISKLKLGSALQSVTLQVEGNTDLYGVSFEDAKGICVDNFSVRGNSGLGLGAVSEQMYKNFDAIHPYDLVVISYGLNVANAKSKNYDWYTKGMSQNIGMMKRAFPHASILVVGCSDRGQKVDGVLQTMPGIKELIEAQRKMAADNQVCFYNLFEAMGGDSTMVRWANAKPKMANGDYTHPTYYGGKKVAEIITGTILYEKEKYERRKKSL